MELQDVVKSKLNLIAEYNAQIDVANMDKQTLIDQVLTPEIKAKIAEIEAEFAGKTEAANANIAALTKEVKGMVILAGESIKADHLHAIFVKGRTSWDTKVLDRYANAHPEILIARLEGDPSVSIRKV